MAKRQGNRNDFEDVSSFSSRSDYRKARTAKKGGHKVIKGLIVFLCVLLIGMGGLTIFAANYLFGEMNTRTITKDKDELGIASGVIENPQITNIALFGVDSRANVFEGRSDVIMILSIDQVHNKIKLTSVLRDCRVYIGEGTDTGYDKITHAYAYGGAPLAIKTLNQNFGLNIYDYITVNFAKMTQIVDAFGGVELEITAEEAEQININLQDDAGVETFRNEDVMAEQDGMTHLNGNQAVAYSRIRHIGNDNARAGRQQILLSALMDKASALSVLELPGVVKKINSLCESSLGLSKLLSFVPMAGSGFTIDRAVVPDENFEGLEGGEFEGANWMWDLDIDAATEHINDFIYEGDDQYANAVQ